MKALRKLYALAVCLGLVSISSSCCGKRPAANAEALKILQNPDCQKMARVYWHRVLMGDDPIKGSVDRGWECYTELDSAISNLAGEDDEWPPE